jgi:hypothetical protein
MRLLPADCEPRSIISLPAQHIVNKESDMKVVVKPVAKAVAVAVSKKATKPALTTFSKKTAVVVSNTDNSSSTTSSSTGPKLLSHLFLKRFADNDPKLTDGANRNRTKNPHVAVVELDPSGRAKCKLCATVIPKGDVRVTLMLECHKGYRFPATLHETCFYKHPETTKLTSMKEILVRANVSDSQKHKIEAHVIGAGGGVAVGAP